MWSRIGDFHDPSWHPAIASVARRSAAVRELTLHDGAVLLETRIDERPRSFTCRIEDGPLPMRGCESLAVGESGSSGCEVTWTASFEPAGVSEAEAARRIALAR